MFFNDFISFAHKHANAIYNSSAVESKTSLQTFHFNSSLLSKDSVFIALTGGNRDGHLFIESAISKGAVCVIVSELNVELFSSYKDVCFVVVNDTLSYLQDLASFYRREILNADVIAITGSNGKTTTKDILYTLLSSKFKTHKTLGNLNNHIGVPITLLNAPEDTEKLILEMGMNHFGEIEKLVSISTPDFAIITSIGESHIEFLGSREGIAKAKSEITKHFTKDNHLFLPRDSDMIDALLSFNRHLDNSQITLFGSSNSERIKEFSTFNNIDFTYLTDAPFFTESFNTNFFDEAVNIPLVGIHNVNNAMPCLFIAHEFGLTIEEVNEALEHLSITAMRFERIATDRAFTLINDAYNASPSSMKANIVTFLEVFKKKQRVLVLGDMYELGDDSYELHGEVGTFLNDFEDKISSLVTIGEYSTKLSSSFNGIHRHFDTKEEAAKWLRNFNDPNFALFFKASRGMHLEELIQTIA